MSNFAILRIAKIKSQLHITNAVKHNYRKIPSLGTIQPRPVQYIHGDENASDSAKEILSTVRVRKNAVYALEIMLTASPEYYRDDPDDAGVYDFSAYEAIEAKALSWLTQTFGEQNIISTVGHLDESSPHFHCLVIPIDPKGKLNAQHWVGSPDKLRKLQTSWANAVEPLGLIRGIPSSIPKKHSPIGIYRQFTQMGLVLFRQLMNTLKPKKNKESNADQRSLTLVYHKRNMIR